MEKNKEDKGFFQRIKDVVFGKDDEDFAAEGYTEDTETEDTEETATQEEQELNQITESVIFSAEKPRETESSTEQTTNTAAKKEKEQLQKISKEEIEAIPENKQVIEILKTIIDPELQIDIWTLGLIYNIKLNSAKKEVTILLTFTSMMCPLGPMIVKNVEEGVKKIQNIHTVHVEVTFIPPWEPTDELREMLGV